MPSQNSDGNESYRYKIDESDRARLLSARIKEMNCMISWCTINQECIHKDPNVTIKFSRIIRQLENYRNDLCSKYAEYKQLVVHARKLIKCGSESREFKNVEKEYNDLLRELQRMFDNAGHLYQALITKQFHKDKYFTITDIEVSGDDYNFDIEIADEDGSRYCIEVWQGYNKLHYAMNDSTALMGVYNGKIHVDKGSVPDRLANVKSSLGGISMSSKHDLPKIWKKIEQLPDDRTGFLIAVRRSSNHPIDIWGTSFPIVPPERMPPNKCIIVANIDAGATSEKLGTAFLIHHPNFKPEVAKKIIRSLKFKFDQNTYTEKKQNYKQFDLR